MKAIIVGNSGSGKTWLAKRWAVALSANVIHLDGIFWEPGGFDVRRSKQQIDFLVQQSKQDSSWIVEGVFGELAEQFFDEAKFLIWLDIDWCICELRLQNRGSQSKRHLDRVQSDKGRKQLIEWASHYYDREDLRSYKGHKLLFERFLGDKAHLKSEDAVNDFLVRW